MVCPVIDPPGLAIMAKGMYEVGRLATLIQELSYMLNAIVSEETFEGDDDSPLPDLLRDNVDALLDTLLKMVEEEAEEIRDGALGSPAVETKALPGH